MNMRLFVKTPLLVSLALVAAGLTGRAQSNRVPGPQDYSAFSQFITGRNIFDPSRQPHEYSNRPYHPTRRFTAAPTIQLVGIMSYEKGYFAFFSGNSSDLSQVVQVGGKINGNTVTDITANSVIIEGADHKSAFMNLGDGWRQESGKWLFYKSGEMPLAGSEAPGSGVSAGTEPAAPGSAAPVPPPSTGEQNDILKRLMQQREKENQ